MSDEINRALGRIEGAMEAIKQDTSEIKVTLDQHNQRIGAIESFKVQILTIAGFVGAGVSVAWDAVKAKMGV